LLPEAAPWENIVMIYQILPMPTVIAVRLAHSIGNGYARGIMTNLHKESAKVQRELMAKAMRTPLPLTKDQLCILVPKAIQLDLGSRSIEG
jgi:hypothetical protein